MKRSLFIESLSVNIQEKPIIRGLSLEVKPGELHVIMGPNGSGKSTLAATLAGHPDYLVGSGTVHLDDVNLLDKSPDERARLGLFLAFQYPVEVPGVTVQTFLRQAHQARFATQPDKQFPTILGFRAHLEKLAGQLQIKSELLKRGLNEGFSGGEKKRLEILQMAVLEPSYAILDESDSGLDIDAVKKVATGIEWVRSQFHTGMMLITHYQRIVKYLHPTMIHVMMEGQLVESGETELLEKIEREGYQSFVNKSD